MNKQPFTHFDLPRQHLSEQGHYIPPRAREEAEIQRRRMAPSGTVLAEQQAKGYRVAAYVLEHVDEESLTYSSNLISYAALNSGWYTFAKNAPDVMRRRLYLPKLADHETDWRQNLTDLRIEATANFSGIVALADQLSYQVEIARPYKRTATNLGKLAGTTALQLAVVHRSALPAGNAFEVQKQARDMALQTLNNSREYGLRNSAHISVAQFADPDSPLSVEWRRTAPNQAFYALEEAQAV